MQKIILLNVRFTLNPSGDKWLSVLELLFTVDIDQSDILNRHRFAVVRRSVTRAGFELTAKEVNVAVPQDVSDLAYRQIRFAE